MLRITRATLVDLGRTSVSTVLESLVVLLEDLARPYSDIAALPSHVLLSQAYVMALAADCCSANWALVVADGRAGSDTQIEVTTDAWAHMAASFPSPLDKSLVRRLFDVLTGLFDPVPEDFILPAHLLLDQAATQDIAAYSFGSVPGQSHPSSRSSDLPASRLGELEAHVKLLVGFITTSSWPSTLEYFKDVIRRLRSSVPASASASEVTGTAQDGDKPALVVLRLLAFFWVDGPKLSLIIQELCSSYLHLRRPYQNAVAAALPLLIIRWIERLPSEFVQIHQLHKRLDGGADTLFDMAQTIVDAGRRRAHLYPLQTTLLFLLPDVFEVASHLRDAKSSSVAKKVSFFDGLRKALRNGSDQATWCLVSLLRAARHFNVDDDSAFMSYALDVQDEVRDAVFRWTASNNEAMHFGQDMTTAAFVSLAHLSFDEAADALFDKSISASAPYTLRIAVVETCRYFARQSDSVKFNRLFDKALPFMQAQLAVRTLDDRPTCL